jgi:hypothetical protein
LPFEALEPQIRERLAARKLHAGRRELEARLLEEYKPTNCIRLLAESLGLGWPEERTHWGTDEDEAKDP